MKVERLLQKLNVVKTLPKQNTLEGDKSGVISSNNGQNKGSQSPMTKPSTAPLQTTNNESKVVMKCSKTINDKATSPIDGSKLKKITSLDKLINKYTDGKPPIMIKDKNVIRKTNLFASSRQLHDRILFPQEGNINDRKLSSQDVTTVDTRNESKIDANLSWGLDGDKIQKRLQVLAKQPTKHGLTKTQERLPRITSPLRFDSTFLKNSSRASLGCCSSQNFGNKPYVKTNNQDQRLQRIRRLHLGGQIPRKGILCSGQKSRSQAIW
jgi:hypothetical protein